MSGHNTVNTTQKDMTVVKRNEGRNFIFDTLTMDLVGFVLVTLCLTGTLLFYLSLPEFFEPLKIANPEYQFPTMDELLPQALLYLIPIFITYYLIKIALFDWTDTVINEKIRSESDSETLNIYRNKICTTIFKIGFYSFSTIYGYYHFAHEDYFPTNLLGAGQYKNIWAKGYPHYFYYNRSDAFNFYYQINLSFVIFDFYLLLSLPLQNDFLFMLIHHICTLSLVIFSFLTNYSYLGIVIYYLHYFGDIFVYLARLSVQTKTPNFFKLIMAVVLLLIFAYTRIFVFGGLIMDYYFYTHPGWKMLEWCLFVLKGSLYILHVLWTFMIAMKVYKYIVSSEVEDIYKLKHKSR